MDIRHMMKIDAIPPGIVLNSYLPLMFKLGNLAPKMSKPIISFDISNAPS